MNGSTPAVPGRYASFAGILTACAVFALTGCASSNPFQDDPEATPNIAQRTDGNVITAADIAQSPTSTSIQQILQRYVPGFRITGDNSVSILGMGNPVFVLDGITLERPDMALGVNPRDVERIEVLKHGASTALYGFRGSNGAVVITTKR